MVTRVRLLVSEYILSSVTGLAPWFVERGFYDGFLFCVISVNI